MTRRKACRLRKHRSVFFIGAGLNRRIAPLRRWNIPDAVTGGLLAIFTRDYWSVDMLKSIKSLTAYSLLGEAFLIYLGDYIAGMGNIDPVVRMLFLAVVFFIIVVIGIAIIRLYLSERTP